jgi:hypothetical protein
MWFFECASGSPRQGLSGTKSLLQPIEAVRLGQLAPRVAVSRKNAERASQASDRIPSARRLRETLSLNEYQHNTIAEFQNNPAKGR